MVTGQITRAEAEAALRRLEGLRDDWRKQISRWKEHYEKADNIKKLQRQPSAPLVFTVEACLNQVGIATIRFNELERIIQDFRQCALYLVHLPTPQEPDASFRSALPDLWSIPHAAPGTSAVALAGHLAGAEAQLVPVSAVQGLSSEIQMLGGYDPSQGMGGMGGMQGYQQGGMPGMMSGLMQGQATGMGGMLGGGSAGFGSGGGGGVGMRPQPTGFGGSQFGGGPYGTQAGFGMQQSGSGFSYNPHTNTPGGYSSQPLDPQSTASMYAQQTGWSQANAQQARVNDFASNVFRPGSGFQGGSAGGGGGGMQHASPLNPFNPTAPHGAVMDASQRFPAIQ